MKRILPIVLLLILSIGLSMALEYIPQPTPPHESDVKTFLAKFAPDTIHEDFPHGTSRNGIEYDWGIMSKGWPVTLTAPYNYINWWGEIYVNKSNYHAPNTRVAIKDVKMLIMYDDEKIWRVVQTGGVNNEFIGADQYLENFYPPDVKHPTTTKKEPDGSISYVPDDGFTAHFWPTVATGLPVVKARAGVRIHILVLAETRLVIANTALPDDRDTAHYVINMGADSRDTAQWYNYGKVDSLGNGKFIKITNEWRTVVMSTMTLDELNRLPMPPKELLGTASLR